MLKNVEIEPGFPDLDTIAALAREAFPPEEYMSPQEILDLKQKDDLSFQAYYDDNNNNFVGYSLVKKYGKMAYLFFLAVDPGCRQSGYGSKILENLKEQYSCQDFVLTIDFEKPDPDAQNAAQRIRRKNFYLKNGFRETGCYQTMRGIDFEIVTSKLPFDFAGFQEMMHSLPIPDLHLRFYSR